MNTGRTNGGPDPDDVAGEQLREVLHQAAGSVDPADGSLGRVLTRAHQRSVWSWGGPVLAAAAAVLVVVGAGVYAGTRGHDNTPPAGQSPSGSSLPSGPSASTTESPSVSHSPTPTGTGPLVALPVYYGGLDSGQARLYREFHPTRTTAPARDAVVQSLEVPPTDPDYQSLWPAGTKLVGYAKSGTLADVTLSNPPQTFPTAAFQQIVYTVTAADPSVRSVRISYGSITQNPMTRGPALGTLAPVWLLAPAQGATVSSPVTLSGQAGVFEATVNWEVDRANGTPVTSGSAMTPQAFLMGPWSTTVTLPPGQYVAKAFEISAKDGLWTWVDSKAFTVR